MTQKIITRFAPSPTGYLHIGGARTALFNWLYARGHLAGPGSQFLLRIEDTDRARHNEEAVTAILDGLRWMGLDWDGVPISQFARADRHREVAEALVQSGNAYRCWLEGEDLNAAREKAKTENTRFESPWRDYQGTTPDGPFAIRLKAPQSGETLIPDLIQGDVKFSSASLDDMVLLRSDGTPTYMLAVVVDDYDMGITHIIRGDDHLVNAARQKQLFNAMGWALPAFAHMPLIHGPDGKKLSKRHGALGVEAYRDDGYLADAVNNYLMRLGWSHGDDEIIPQDKALDWFDLKDINKAPSRLDLDKLKFVNSHYLQKLSSDKFTSLSKPFMLKAKNNITDVQHEGLNRAIPFLKERSKTLCDVVTAAEFILCERPLRLEDKAAKPLKKEGAIAHLRAIYTLLEAVDIWETEPLTNAIQAYADSHNIGFGQVGPPIRAALTGGAISPNIGDVLYALGKEEALARIADQLVTV